MEKLSWDEIKRRYPNEHVELIDYDWDETEPYPRAGVVRVHSKDNCEFWGLLKDIGQLNSAVLFTGRPFTQFSEAGSAEILSVSRHRIETIKNSNS